MVDVVVENEGEKRAGATKRMRIVGRVKTWRGQRNRGYELRGWNLDQNKEYGIVIYSCFN
ncbi:hypothetical protein C5S31_04255 [ANME-1 cluster archaeon GoMg2]|nr:hypothetical protein [ANME-1 cluster archaeon GoMg2]